MGLGVITLAEGAPSDGGVREEGLPRARELAHAYDALLAEGAESACSGTAEALLRDIASRLESPSPPLARLLNMLAEVLRQRLLNNAVLLESSTASSSCVVALAGLLRRRNAVCFVPLSRAGAEHWTESVGRHLRPPLCTEDIVLLDASAARVVGALCTTGRLTLGEARALARVAPWFRGVVTAWGDAAARPLAKVLRTDGAEVLHYAGSSRGP